MKIINSLVKGATLWAFLLQCPALVAKDISVEKEYKFTSQVAKQSLSYRVLLPAHYDPDTAYPVLYSTSGFRRLELLRQQINWLSHVGMGAMPNMLIVSVPDVKVETTLHPKNVGAAGITHQLTTQVLELELIPRIEKHYKVRPFRILEGYSSYGALPLHILLNQPDMFNGYVSVTPALALDQTGLLEQWQTRTHQFDYTHRFFYLSQGSFTENQQPMAKALILLKDNRLKNLQWQFEDQSQHNFLMPGVTDTVIGLETLFSDNRITDFSSFSQSGIPGIKAYFAVLSEKYGYAMDTEQSFIDYSFFMSEQGAHQQALSAMQQVSDNKPDNIFLLTRLAAIQLAAGQKSATIKTLKQAKKKAQLSDNQDALQYIRQKLNEVG